MCIHPDTHTHTHTHMYSCGSNKLLESGTEGNSQGGDGENTPLPSYTQWTWEPKYQCWNTLVEVLELRHASHFNGNAVLNSFKKPPIAQREFCEWQILQVWQSNTASLKASCVKHQPGTKLLNGLIKHQLAESWEWISVIAIEIRHFNSDVPLCEGQ